MRMLVRGQAAAEFLAVVAFFMLVTIPLFAYFYTSAPQKEYYASASQAESAASEFIKYGELVGTQASGTNITRLIVLPKYTTKMVFNGTNAVVHLEYSDMKTDIVRLGSVNFTTREITGITGGTYAFVFTNNNGNVEVSIKK